MKFMTEGPSAVAGGPFRKKNGKSSKRHRKDGKPKLNSHPPSTTPY